MKNNLQKLLSTVQFFTIIY